MKTCVEYAGALEGVSKSRTPYRRKSRRKDYDLLRFVREDEKPNNVLLLDRVNLLIFEQVENEPVHFCPGWLLLIFERKSGKQDRFYLASRACRYQNNTASNAHG